MLLWVAVLGGIVLSVLTGVVWYLIGRLAVADADPSAARASIVRWNDVGQFVGLCIMLMSLLLWVLGPIETLPSVPSVPVSEPFRVAATALLLGVSGYLPRVTAQIALLPTEVEARNLEKPTSTYLGRKLQFYTLLLTLLVGCGLFGAALHTVVGPLGSLAIAPSVFYAVYLLLSPALNEIVSESHEPTRTERERLDAVCSEFGLDDTAYLVVDEDQAGFTLVGTPLNRTLVVTSPSLSAENDERLRAMAAIAAGIVRGRYRLAVFVVYGLLFFPSFGLMAYGLLASFLVTAVGVGLLVVGFVAAYSIKSRVYAADAYAAGEIGTEAVLEALAWICRSNDIDPESGEGDGGSLIRPSLSDRYQRLRASLSD